MEGEGATLPERGKEREMPQVILYIGQGGCRLRCPDRKRKLGRGEGEKEQLRHHGQVNSRLLFRLHG